MNIYEYEDEYKKEEIIDKRKGPDFFIKMLTWLAVLGWFCLFIALLIIEKAKPYVYSFFVRYYNVEPKPFWDPKLSRYIFYLMVAGAMLSAIGLIINFKRHHRKSDHYRSSLISLIIISIFGIFIYLI